MPNIQHRAVTVTIRSSDKLSQAWLAVSLLRHIVVASTRIRARCPAQYITCHTSCLLTYHTSSPHIIPLLPHTTHAACNRLPRTCPTPARGGTVSVPAPGFGAGNSSPGTSLEPRPLLLSSRTPSPPIQSPIPLHKTKVTKAKHPPVLLSRTLFLSLAPTPQRRYQRVPPAHVLKLVVCRPGAIGRHSPTRKHAGCGVCSRAASHSCRKGRTRDVRLALQVAWEHIYTCQGFGGGLLPPLSLLSLILVSTRAQVVRPSFWLRFGPCRACRLD